MSVQVERGLSEIKRDVRLQRINRSCMEEATVRRGCDRMILQISHRLNRNVHVAYSLLRCVRQRPRYQSA